MGLVCRFCGAAGGHPGPSVLLHHAATEGAHCSHETEYHQQKGRSVHLVLLSDICVTDAPPPPPYTHTHIVSLPIQLAAADSLLELCPPRHPSAKEATAAINTWLEAHCRHPAGMVLAQEFNSRLQPYLHITNI